MSDVMPARLLNPAAVSLYTQLGQCDDCRWPDVCQRDGTCWHAERSIGRLWTARTVVSESCWSAETIVLAAREWNDRYGRPPLWAEWQRPESSRPSVAQVLAVFGRWNAMLEAAGFSPRTGGRANRSRPLEEVVT